MNCLLCHKPVTEPGALFDSALCEAASFELARGRFPRRDTPPVWRERIDRFIAGQLSAAEEAALLAWLTDRGEQG